MNSPNKYTNNSQDVKNNTHINDLLQILEQNKFKFIDKLDLTKTSHSTANKSTKRTNEAKPILGQQQFKIFESIIDDLSTPSVFKPTQTTSTSKHNILSSAAALPPLPCISLSIPQINNINTYTAIKPSQNIPKTNSLPPPPFITPFNPNTINGINGNANINKHFETGIEMNESFLKNDNNKNTKINISQITDCIPCSTSSNNFISFKDMVNASNTPEILMQDGLSAISDSYNTHIGYVHNDLKQYQRSTSLVIQHIDNKLNMLSLQKKQIKIHLSNYTKDANDKLDELEAHKNYIDTINDRYKKSFANHLINNNNKNEIPKWKNVVLDVIEDYKPQIEQFVNKQNKILMELRKPMFPPKASNHSNDHNIISKKLNVMGGINNINNNINIHTISDSESDSSDSESQPIINLKNKKNKKKKIIDITDDNYPLHLDLQVVLRFGKNQLIDYRDFNGRYLKAKIMQLKWDSDQKYFKFGIHYINWDNKWNVWSIPKYQFKRYNNFASISERGLHRDSMKYVSLKKPFGDYIEVKPLHLYYQSVYKLKHQTNEENKKDIDKYLSWHMAQVCLNDKFSAQVQVVLLIKNKFAEWCKPNPKPDLYWVHLDNEQECAPINTHIINPMIKKNIKKKKRNNNDNSITPPMKKQRQN